MSKDPQLSLTINASNITSKIHSVAAGIYLYFNQHNNINNFTDIIKNVSYRNYLGTL